MRKLFAFLITCHLSLVTFCAQSAQYNAVLVADMDTGAVLYQERATELNYPASLTKIMTMYLAFDALEHGRLHLDDYLIVSQAAANASPIKLGVAAGSKIRVEDAIKAVAVISANDIARVLAENLKGGKEGNFASLMTDVASQIGLSQTNFENSSGLPDDDHMSSARDIALLSMAVYKHFPQYWKYFGIKTWEYNGKTYTNGNRLLGSYPGCDGMKTGFTNKSKYSLVATAQRDGRRIMSVVLGATNKDVRADVARRMLDKGFTLLGQAPTVQSKELRVESKDMEKSQSAISTNHESRVTNNGVAKGDAGIQFGAFGSSKGAQTQQTRVQSALGVATVIEVAPNGMFRVRARGLSESSAQSIAARCRGAGIDCFIFR
ncbi:MAG: D-alanyl-D-alanine carboxypeptidase [Alphaproteobacteria bacterium]|nr:D-alanyl-D-alanine carboxypeptidase [Alphaproteobacteria bacterium]